MSAVIVEDEIINSPLGLFYTEAVGSGVYDEIPRRLKQAGYNIGEDETEIIRLAEEMFRLNCEAVNQRYGEGAAESFRELNFKYQFMPGTSAVQAYQALSCWLYQCTEGDIPKSSPLYEVINKISDVLAHRIAMNTPECKKARWE